MAMTAMGNAVTPIAAATAPLLLAVTAATFGIPEAVAYLVAKSPAALPGVARRGAWLILLSGALATGICVLASNASAGQSLFTPSHTSCTSQIPATARHTSVLF